MNREQIYEQLEIERFEIARRDCTPRVMAQTNILLDSLILIQYEEAIEMLQEETNV